MNFECWANFAEIYLIGDVGPVGNFKSFSLFMYESHKRLDFNLILIHTLNIK